MPGDGTGSPNPFPKQRPTQTLLCQETQQRLVHNNPSEAETTRQVGQSIYCAR